MWSQDGDCVVHLYGRGRSKRGPSLKVSSKDLDAAEWEHMVKMYSGTSESPCSVQSLTPSSSCSSLAQSGIFSTPIPDGSLELFIAAPALAMREDALKWHVTTRNFFAWMNDKPLVGTTLGQALIDLLDRMLLYREHADNVGDIISYAKSAGYLDFINCPDYALAFLRFAEHCHLPDLWIDAFSHCVGLNDQLYLSSGFDVSCSSTPIHRQHANKKQAISQVTKALITRAYLEMDLHLGRVTRALQTFLEEELSPAQFGLPVGAQAHLDRFRSFLHSFYVNQYGYWPPENGSVFGKSLLWSMYTEFHNLYEFLVDGESSNSLQDQNSPASGGICVLQNVNGFNQRHNYEPLPHPLPLLPDYDSSTAKTHSQRGLRAFRLGNKPSKFEQSMSMRSALAIATNSVLPDAAECPLVKDYVRFEREWSIKPEEKISVVDARKVRWIVVYSVLQMLISVTRAPKEVRQSTTAPYHLCLLTTGTPPWTEATNAAATSEVASHSWSQTIAGDNKTDAVYDIRPDCEVEDYLPKRMDSVSSLRPAPLKINTSSLTRTNSIKSLQNMLASIPMPSRQNSIKAASPLSATQTHDLGVSMFDHGHGLSSTSIQRSMRDCATGTKKPCPRQTYRPLMVSELEKRSREAPTPTLDFYMLDGQVDTSSPSSSISYSRPSSMSSPASTSRGSWHIDESDAFSWTSGDDRRNSKGIYSMEHESVYSGIEGGSSSGMRRFSNSAIGTSYSPTTPPSLARSGFSSQELCFPWSTPTAQTGSAKGDKGHSKSPSSSSTVVPEKNKSHAADGTWGSLFAKSQGSNDGETREQVEMEMEMPDMLGQIDIHRALDLLPLHIPAQAL